MAGCSRGKPLPRHLLGQARARDRPRALPAARRLRCQDRRTRSSARSPNRSLFAASRVPPPWTRVRRAACHTVAGPPHRRRRAGPVVLTVLRRGETLCEPRGPGRGAPRAEPRRRADPRAPGRRGQLEPGLGGPQVDHCGVLELRNDRRPAPQPRHPASVTHGEGVGSVRDLPPRPGTQGRAQGPSSAVRGPCPGAWGPRFRHARPVPLVRGRGPGCQGA